MLTDTEIQSLIDEEKLLPPDFREALKLKSRPDLKFKTCDIAVRSRSGRNFQIKVRLSTLNKFNFSVILIYIDKNGIDHILRRYNGNYHEHKNKLEKNMINGFHIHKATERYQLLCNKIDGYAELTDSYSAWGDALNQMIEDCNLKTTYTKII